MAMTSAIAPGLDTVGQALAGAQMAASNVAVARTQAGAAQNMQNQQLAAGRQSQESGQSHEMNMMQQQGQLGQRAMQMDHQLNMEKASRLSQLNKEWATHQSNISEALASKDQERILQIYGLSNDHEAKMYDLVSGDNLATTAAAIAASLKNSERIAQIMAQGVNVPANENARSEAMKTYEQQGSALMKSIAASGKSRLDGPRAEASTGQARGSGGFSAAAPGMDAPVPEAKPLIEVNSREHIANNRAARLDAQIKTDRGGATPAPAVKPAASSTGFQYSIKEGVSTTPTPSISQDSIVDPEVLSAINQADDLKGAMQGLLKERGVEWMEGQLAKIRGARAWLSGPETGLSPEEVADRMGMLQGLEARIKMGLGPEFTAQQGARGIVAQELKDSMAAAGGDPMELVRQLMERAQTRSARAGRRVPQDWITRPKAPNSGGGGLDWNALMGGGM